MASHDAEDSGVDVEGDATGGVEAARSVAGSDRPFKRRRIGSVVSDDGNRSGLDVLADATSQMSPARPSHRDRFFGGNSRRHRPRSNSMPQASTGGGLVTSPYRSGAGAGRGAWNPESGDASKKSNAHGSSPSRRRPSVSRQSHGPGDSSGTPKASKQPPVVTRSGRRSKPNRRFK